MALFNWFGEQEHRVYNYKPRYYDPEKEAREKKFHHKKKEEEEYTPGSYVKGAFRNGNYSRERGHSNKVQNIIGIIGLLLIAVILFYIVKFYALL